MTIFVKDKNNNCVYYSYLLIEVFKIWNQTIIENFEFISLKFTEQIECFF